MLLAIEALLLQTSLPESVRLHADVGLQMEEIRPST